MILQRCYQNNGLTCGVRSGPWLLPVWSHSESERCPGSGPGERSAEGHAACRWSSVWIHQSAGTYKMDNGEFLSDGLRYVQCFPYMYLAAALWNMTAAVESFFSSRAERGEERRGLHLISLETNVIVFCATTPPTSQRGNRCGITFCACLWLVHEWSEIKQASLAILV